MRRFADCDSLRGVRPAPAAGFTIVELAVVVAVVGLILAIAVPGLRRMSEDARFSSAIQSINGTLQRAYYDAVADQNLAAVRIHPGAWDLDEQSNLTSDAGRQHLVSYRYVGATSREQPPGSGNFVTEYGERFERRPGSNSVVLPPDIWAAPIEAWRDRRADPLDGSRNPLDESILAGEIGRFALDPVRSGEELLEADDFLIVFDPQTGVRSGRAAFQLKAYNPALNPPAEVFDDGTSNPNRPRFLRSSSEGVVIYPREPFAALGNTASGQDRQATLRRVGRPYFVHRLSGALVAGAQQE